MKKILITGGCGFIGSALAKLWQKEQLLLLDKNLAGLEKLADSLKIEPCLIPFDLEKAKDEDFSQLGQLITKNYGNLDALVHLALPEFRRTNLMLSTGADLDRFFKVIVKAPFLLTQALKINLLNSPNPKVAFAFTELNGAYWHSLAIMQIALEQMIKDLAQENATYEKIAWGKIKFDWIRDSPMVKKIFIKQTEEFKELSEILPKFQEVFNFPAGKLSEVNF